MKILVISSSPRKNGNSDILCDEFVRGAKENNHEVEKIWIGNKKFGFCQACYYCKDTGVCFQKDEVNAILAKLLSVDILVLSTPIYFYDMAGQLKTFIDRVLPVYDRIPIKDVYLIATCADERKSSLDAAIAGVQGFVDCLNNAKFAGIIYGTSAWNMDDVKTTSAMKEAYEMGKKVI